MRRLASLLIALMALFSAPPLAAQTAPGGGQQGPYFNNGRLVGMGPGGERIFFTYYNANYEGAVAAAMQTGQMFLDGFADPGSPAGQSLTADERAIVRAITMRPSQARTAGYRATRTATQRFIEIPGEAAAYHLGLTTSLYYSTASGNGGFFNLFLMSEVDWFAGRSPRWYQAPTYARWAGEDLSKYPMASDPKFSGLILMTSGSMMLHEICHHLKGHIDRPMMERFAALDFLGRQKLRIANELEADRCSAEMGSTFGLPPDLGTMLNLSASIVAGDAPSNTHPMAAERVEQAKGFRAEALAQLRGYDGPGAQPLAMSDEGYAEMVDGLWDTLLRYQSLYAPPADQEP